jgi:hypothetical protein
MKENEAKKRNRDWKETFKNSLAVRGSQRCYLSRDQLD